MYATIKRLCIALLMLMTLGVSTQAYGHAAHEQGSGSVVAAPSKDVAHPLLEGLETDRRLEGVQFHYPPEFGEVLEPLLAKAPGIKKKILEDLSPDALEGVDVYLMPSIEQYFTERGIRPRSPHWASGLALLREDVILIRLDPVANGELELDRTLGHELSHIALHHHVGRRRLPTWFVEGFAILQTEEWTMKRAETLVEANLADTVKPLRRFERGFPRDGVAAELAYAESAHFLFWLKRYYGEERMGDLMTRLGEGEGFDAAFTASYPESFDAIEASWREGLDVDGGWGWIWTLFNAGTAAAVLLLIMGFFAWRLRGRRQAALARLEASEANLDVPEHLKNFGPFGQAMTRG